MSWEKIFDFMPSSKTMANIGQFASPLVSLINASKQEDVIKEQNKIMKDNYNYNKSLNNREIAKENMDQAELVNGFEQVFKAPSKKKKLNDYTGMYNFQG